MNLMLSTIINNIDKKGRVSVPYQYRNHLISEGLNMAILYPSIKHRCIECCSIEKINEISNLISNLDPYSEERDAFETIIFGESVQINFDSEGRIIIPKHLLEYAELDDRICFVGKGGVLELWNPLKFDEHRINAKNIAIKNRSLLKNA